MATIPFISNYCDRWCEKCRFSSQCAVGLAEAKRLDNENDMTNEAFWGVIAEQFSKAMEMIQTSLTERGIVLTEEDLQESNLEVEKRKKKMDTVRETHELATLSMSYSMTATEFLSKDGINEAYQHRLQHEYALGIKSEEAIKQHALNMKNNIDIIQWFMFFIHVKFIRALRPMADDKSDGLEIQSDKNGSAKIAILAVESSLGAWHSIYTDSYYDDREEILSIMAALDKIRRLALQYFPNAMKFVRPGFDAGWQDVWNMDEEE